MANANAQPVPKKIVSIRIDVTLHRKYKVRAAESGVPLAHLMEEALLGAIKTWPKGSR